MTDTIENSRSESLRKAQDRAEELFRPVEAKGLTRPGMTESELNEEVYKFTETEFGVTNHWNKRIVRAGPNTLAPYDENPPDLVIEEDDLVFLDLGPEFEAWEADYSRSFVIGSDPLKQRLRDDIGKALPRARSISNSIRTLPRRSSTTTRRTSRRNTDGNTAVPSRAISWANFPTREFPATKSLCMSIRTIRTACATSGRMDNRATGFSKFTSSTALEKSADPTSSC